MYHTSNNYRAARLCSSENFREPLRAPKHLSWGAEAEKIEPFGLPKILVGVPGPPSWSPKLIDQ